eukprot:TRINITY_DN58493_c0_g1_i1.p1 TRINITY_DN58493_c0_g1~~TRINITY_DN58493_c0_g1_i1.p1  ORF type:complete len:191 (-),score=36.14 TRINITY_DN58493_c0_g1_i1:248-820(-)
MSAIRMVATFALSRIGARLPQKSNFCNLKALGPIPSQLRLFTMPASGFRSFNSSSKVGFLEKFQNSMDAQQLIADLNSSHSAFVLSKSTCPFCKRAKDLLSKLGTSYEVFELDDLSPEAKTVLQVHMKETTGAGSVPRVFVGGKCLGGFSEVQHRLWAGELVPTLVEAGVVAEGAESSSAFQFDAGNPML